MTTIKEKLLDEFQIRKSKQQKTAFRAWLRETLEKEGYTVSEEKGNFSTNVVVGDSDKAKVIFTAHYDTCAVLPIPNFITPRNGLIYILYQLILSAIMLTIIFGSEFAIMFLWEDCPMWAALLTVYAAAIFCFWWLMDGPANKHTANDNTSGVLTLLEIARALPAEQRDKAAFIFFDNEEKGLFGSSAFAGKHKKVKKGTLLLNFDCVSDGDFLHFFPTRKVLKDEETMALLRGAFQPAGEKTVTMTKGIYPSDQKNFARGIGICALKHSRLWGYYMDRIHTNRDTVLDEENIALLRDGAVRLVADMGE